MQNTQKILYNTIQHNTMGRRTYKTQGTQDRTGRRFTTVSIDAATYRHVDEIAQREERSMSWVLRRAVRAYAREHHPGLIAEDKHENDWPPRCRCR